MPANCTRLSLAAAPCSSGGGQERKLFALPRAKAAAHLPHAARTQRLWRVQRVEHVRRRTAGRGRGRRTLLAANPPLHLRARAALRRGARRHWNAAHIGTACALPLKQERDPSLHRRVDRGSPYRRRGRPAGHAGSSGDGERAASDALPSPAAGRWVRNAVAVSPSRLLSPKLTNALTFGKVLSRGRLDRKKEIKPAAAGQHCQQG